MRAHVAYKAQYVKCAVHHAYMDGQARVFAWGELEGVGVGFSAASTGAGVVESLGARYL